jgi:hypothetical protein
MSRRSACAFFLTFGSAALDKLDRDVQYRISDSKALDSSEVDAFYKRLDEILTDIDQKWINTYAIK